MTQPKTASKFTPGPWTLELVGTGSNAYAFTGFPNGDSSPQRSR